MQLFIFIFLSFRKFFKLDQAADPSRLSGCYQSEQFFKAALMTPSLECTRLDQGIHYLYYFIVYPCIKFILLHSNPSPS